ncbi:glycosidase [Shigella dysenteriae]|uniref:extracellular solute-binding protein n=1 Tax=Shigella TaxID=620 RepID=UPI00006738CA|nr:glycosidase [Shigella dysenteriae 1012]EFP7225582.1 extracellular solute-binding protein [Shigella dysenteriae]EGJ03270.1 putative sucrose phosphorylase [Shigella dysenteriae 155-74]EFW8404864.1 extracellular solute-binding protein [Shigella dysenteriae]EFX6527068.1 extracellular solute-binding protein [Shigella dysenteriae]
MKQKITDYLDEIYGGTFTATHLQKLVTRLESAKRLITQRRKKHWDESDVVLITYADQFHSNDLKPLPTFNQFYHQWLQSIFSHVHLLPFYPWSSDDGFSVIDYHQVASEAGEWQDIQQLGECSHLMFDFVCNHMSAKSEWFKNYLQQHPGFEDFFIAVDPQTDLSAVTRPRALPLLTPFQMDDNSTRHLWTTFSDDQIDLNYRSPEVLLAMVDVLLCYLEKGAEYVRLDAVGFMWKELGTSCIHLEKTHLIIKLLRSIIDNVAPGTVIITETNVPHKDNIAYFGEGDDEAHMVYQFSLPPLVLHAVQKQNVEALCQWAQSLSLPSGKTTWFNFLASHDGIGLNPLRGLLPESEILELVEALQQEGALVNWKNNPDGTRSPYEIKVTYMDALSRRESSDEERCARFILAHAILLSFPGVPAIYIQSILGSRNDYAGVEKLGYNRAINRKKYHSEEITRELNDEATLRHAVYHELSRLITLRRSHNEFHPDNNFTIDTVNSSVMRIQRSNVGEGAFYDGVLRIVRTEDGSAWTGVPVSAWIGGIWYRKDVLAKAGLEEPKNWQQLLDVAQKLNDPANKKYGIALPTAESVLTEQSFSQFALSNQANVFNAEGKITLDTPEMMQALTYYRDLAANTMPGSNDIMEVKDAFMNGTAPMAIYSTYILPAVIKEGDPKNVGFVVPTEKNSAVYGMLTSLTITAGQKTEETEAAEKFVTFMEQADNIADWVMMSPGAALPVNKAVVTTATWKDNDVIKALGELPNQLIGELPNIQVFGAVGDKNYTRMGDVTGSGVVSSMVHNVTVGKADLPGTLQASQKKLDELIEQH